MPRDRIYNEIDEKALIRVKESDSKESILVKTLNKSDLPILFTYGDSDLQFNIYKIGRDISYKKYFIAMERAFRLLISFKGFSNQILIPASSLIQSNLTETLAEKYSNFSLCGTPHFYILRREPDWKTYLLKRWNTAENLYHYKTYSRYFKSDILDRLGRYSTLSKRIYAGKSCSEVWVNEAPQILSNWNKKQLVGKSILQGMSEEILSNGIFVWENIGAMLTKYNIKIPSYSKDLQLLLIRAYLDMSQGKVQFPFGIELKWELVLSPPKSYYCNLKLLHLILKYSGVSQVFFKIQPLKLYRLLSNGYFIEYKSKLQVETTDNNHILIAYKHRRLFQKAIKEIM